MRGRGKPQWWSCFQAWVGIFWCSVSPLSVWILVSSVLHNLGHLAQKQMRCCVGGWIWISSTGSTRDGSRVYKFHCKGFHRWIAVFVALYLFRVGEASHPGPQVGQTDTWTLGVANPSGLNGKLDQVAHLGGDAWVLTETQLSRQGISTFVKGLKMLHSPWKYAIAGAPCRPRQHTDTGVHSGVMLVSRHPARALPHNFDDVVYESARVQVVGMAVSEIWVTIGLLYGLPCNASHKQARYQTDALLSELVDRIGEQTTGPRVIGGDFNYGPDELAQLSRLAALGFREVQDLRAWRFGCSTEATGRGTRRLDQMWISPELQQVYKGTQVDFSQWPDHAAVSASFSLSGLSTVTHAWHVPQPFPWPSEWQCPVQVDMTDDPTVAYAQFWQQVESHAKCRAQVQGQRVSKKQCGRASVLSTVEVKAFGSPVKKGRKGDLQPGYLGVSLQHARFFRQLRRLQSLVRILRKGVTTWSGRFNRDETWKSIRCAVGFPGGFGHWWTSVGLEPSLSCPLPLCCPELDFAQGLFLGFQQFMAGYEKSLIQQRYQFAKQRRETSLAYVFQDCKEDPLPQADTLLDRVEEQVEEVRADDCSLVLARPTKLLEGLPVVVAGRAVEVVAHSEDQVWLSSVDGLEPGNVLTQERAVSSDAAILQRFEQLWGPRWLKLHHVQPGQWDQICGFLDRTVRPLPWRWEPWSVERFQNAVRHKKERAAKGPDGVSRADLIALPDAACQAMIGFYEAAEQAVVGLPSLPLVLFPVLPRSPQLRR